MHSVFGSSPLARYRNFQIRAAGAAIPQVWRQDAFVSISRQDTLFMLFGLFGSGRVSQIN